MGKHTQDTVERLFVEKAREMFDVWLDARAEHAKLTGDRDGGPSFTEFAKSYRKKEEEVNGVLSFEDDPEWERKFNLVALAVGVVASVVVSVYSVRWRRRWLAPKQRWQLMGWIFTANFFAAVVKESWKRLQQSDSV